MTRKRLSTYEWIEQIFRTRAAMTGGVVRRKVSSVLRYASAEALREACRRRRFHLILNGGYFVILCNNEDYSLLK
jgi:thiamine monophosphate synthase